MKVRQCVAKTNADIDKMKILSKIHTRRAGVSLFFVVFAFAVVISAVVPLFNSVGSASADSYQSGQGTFQYADSGHSSIIETSGGTTQVYTKSSGGKYTGGSAQGFNGCTAVIQTNSKKYDGSSGAQFFASCLGGADKAPNQPGTLGITIQPAPMYIATWVDHNTLQVSDGINSKNVTTYFDGHTDGNENYVAQNQNNSCNANVIKGFPDTPGDPGNSGAAGKATITINQPVSGANNNCTSSTYPITQFQQTQNYSVFFKWVDGGTIETTDNGATMTFEQQDANGPYYDTGSGGSGSSSTCKSTIQADPKDPSHGTLIIRATSGNPFDPGFSPQMRVGLSNKNGCNVSKPMTVNIGGTTNASLAPGSGSTGSGSGSGQPSLSCSYSITNPLTWVICPAVNGMVDIVNELDDAIDSQLSVGTPGNSDDPNQIFCDSSSSNLQNCNAYHTAWSSFRNIALGLLAIVGLIIIISEMAGLELFDAYTIRKVLPRLIFAAIAITLSWQLMQFFITLTNDLGYGIRYLIYQPFVSAGVDQLTLGGGSQAALTFVGAAGIVALGVFGLLSFAATAALAVSIAFLTLIVRQLLIIILIIMAPVAILAFVLPNTQRGWKLWWDSFSKALLMFPLIAAFIASGRVFAAVADSGSTIGQLMGFVAYFAPYFLIPLTFRLAGGAIATIGGFVNDKHRGAFDRLKGYRKNKTESNLQALAAGNRYKASNPAARAFNRTTRGIANIPSAGVTPWKMRSRFQAGMAEKEGTAVDEYMEKSQAWKGIAQNDDLLLATLESQGGGKTEADWRRYLSDPKKGGLQGRALEQSVAAIRAAKRDTNDNVFAEAAARAAASTGTAWKNDGAGGMMAAINEVAGGDRAKAGRMLADMRGRAQQARRVDLSGAGFGGQITDLEAMNNGTMTAETATARNNAKVLELNGAGAIAGARGDSMKLLAPAMKEELAKAYASGNDVTIKRTLAKAANMYDTMAHAAPENAEIFADQVLAQPFAATYNKEKGLWEGHMVKVDRRNAKGELMPQLDASGKTIPVRDSAGNDTGRIHYQQEEVPLTFRRVMERFRNDDEFLNMRRELSSQEQFAQQQNSGGSSDITGGGLGGGTPLAPLGG